MTSEGEGFQHEDPDQLQLENCCEVIQSKNSSLEEKTTAVQQGWETLLSIYEKKTSDNFPVIFDRLYLATAKLILGGEWYKAITENNYKNGDILKNGLLKSLDAVIDKIVTEFPLECKFCLNLKPLLDRSPWALTYITDIIRTGTNRTDSSAVEELWKEENETLLDVRLEFLCSAKMYQEAFSIAQACYQEKEKIQESLEREICCDSGNFKKEQLERRKVFNAELTNFFYLLLCRNKSTVSELDKFLSVPTAVEVVSNLTNSSSLSRRRLAAKWKEWKKACKTIICRTVDFFLKKELDNVDVQLTRDIFTYWIKHAAKDEEEIRPAKDLLDQIDQINSDYIYAFADVLFENFRSRANAVQKTMELYFRAMSKDINQIEKLDVTENQSNRKQDLKNKLAIRYLRLAKLFSCDAKCCWELTLTAFSLSPSEELFKQLFSPENKTTINNIEFSTSTPTTDSPAFELSEALKEDLQTVIANPRWKSLCWAKDKTELERLCRHQLDTGGPKITAKEDLRHLVIDYDKYEPRQDVYDENDYGFEKGYEPKYLRLPRTTTKRRSKSVLLKKTIRRKPFPTAFNNKGKKFGKNKKNKIKNENTNIKNDKGPKPFKSRTTNKIKKATSTSRSPNKIKNNKTNIANKLSEMKQNKILQQYSQYQSEDPEQQESFQDLQESINFRKRFGRRRPKFNQLYTEKHRLDLGSSLKHLPLPRCRSAETGVIIAGIEPEISTNFTRFCADEACKGNELEKLNPALYNDDNFNAEFLLNLEELDDIVKNSGDSSRSADICLATKSSLLPVTNSSTAESFNKESLSQELERLLVEKYPEYFQLSNVDFSKSFNPVILLENIIPLELVQSSATNLAFNYIIQVMNQSLDAFWSACQNPAMSETLQSTMEAEVGPLPNSETAIPEIIREACEFNSQCQIHNQIQNTSLSSPSSAAAPSLVVSNESALPERNNEDFHKNHEILPKQNENLPERVPCSLNLDPKSGKPIKKEVGPRRETNKRYAQKLIEKASNTMKENIAYKGQALGLEFVNGKLIRASKLSEDNTVDLQCVSAFINQESNSIDGVFMKQIPPADPSISKFQFHRFEDVIIAQAVLSGRMEMANGDFSPLNVQSASNLEYFSSPENPQRNSSGGFLNSKSVSPGISRGISPQKDNDKKSDDDSIKGSSEENNSLLLISTNSSPLCAPGSEKESFTSVFTNNSPIINSRSSSSISDVNASPREDQMSSINVRDQWGCSTTPTTTMIIPANNSAMVMNNNESQANVPLICSIVKLIYGDYASNKVQQSQPQSRRQQRSPTPYEEEKDFILEEYFGEEEDGEQNDEDDFPDSNNINRYKGNKEDDDPDYVYSPEMDEIQGDRIVTLKRSCRAKPKRFKDLDEVRNKINKKSNAERKKEDKEETEIVNEDSQPEIFTNNENEYEEGINRKKFKKLKGTSKNKKSKKKNAKEPDEDLSKKLAPFIPSFPIVPIVPKEILIDADAVENHASYTIDESFLDDSTGYFFPITPSLDLNFPSPESSQQIWDDNFVLVMSDENDEDSIAAENTFTEKIGSTRALLAINNTKNQHSGLDTPVGSPQAPPTSRSKKKENSRGRRQQDSCAFYSSSSSNESPVGSPAAAETAGSSKVVKDSSAVEGGEKLVTNNGSQDQDILILSEHNYSTGQSDGGGASSDNNNSSSTNHSSTIRGARRSSRRLSLKQCFVLVEKLSHPNDSSNNNSNNNSDSNVGSPPSREICPSTSSETECVSGGGGKSKRGRPRIASGSKSDSIKITNDKNSGKIDSVVISKRNLDTLLLNIDNTNSDDIKSDSAGETTKNKKIRYGNSEKSDSNANKSDTQVKNSNGSKSDKKITLKKDCKSSSKTKSSPPPTTTPTSVLLEKESPPSSILSSSPTKRGRGRPPEVHKRIRKSVRNHASSLSKSKIRRSRHSSSDEDYDPIRDRKSPKKSPKKKKNNNKKRHRSGVGKGSSDGSDYNNITSVETIQIDDSDVEPKVENPKNNENVDVVKVIIKLPQDSFSRDDDRYDKSSGDENHSRRASPKKESSGDEYRNKVRQPEIIQVDVAAPSSSKIFLDEISSVRSKTEELAEDTQRTSKFVVSDKLTAGFVEDQEENKDLLQNKSVTDEDILNQGSSATEATSSSRWTKLAILEPVVDLASDDDIDPLDLEIMESVEMDDSEIESQPLIRPEVFDDNDDTENLVNPIENAILPELSNDENSVVLLDDVPDVSNNNCNDVEIENSHELSLGFNNDENSVILLDDVPDVSNNNCNDVEIENSHDLPLGFNNESSVLPDSPPHDDDHHSNDGNHSDDGNHNYDDGDHNYDDGDRNYDDDDHNDDDHDDDMENCLSPDVPSNDNLDNEEENSVPPDVPDDDTENSTGLPHVSNESEEHELALLSDQNSLSPDVPSNDNLDNEEENSVPPDAPDDDTENSTGLPHVSNESEGYEHALLLDLPVSETEQSPLLLDTSVESESSAVLSDTRQNEDLVNLPEIIVCEGENSEFTQIICDTQKSENSKITLICGSRNSKLTNIIGEKQSLGNPELTQRICESQNSESIEIIWKTDSSGLPAEEIVCEETEAEENPEEVTDNNADNSVLPDIPDDDFEEEDEVNNFSRNFKLKNISKAYLSTLKARDSCSTTNNERIKSASNSPGDSYILVKNDCGGEIRMSRHEPIMSNITAGELIVTDTEKSNHGFQQPLAPITTTFSSITATASNNDIAERILLENIHAALEESGLISGEEVDDDYEEENQLDAIEDAPELAVEETNPVGTDFILASKTTTTEVEETNPIETDFILASKTTTTEVEETNPVGTDFILASKTTTTEVEETNSVGTDFILTSKTTTTEISKNITSNDILLPITGQLDLETTTMRIQSEDLGKLQISVQLPPYHQEKHQHVRDNAHNTCVFYPVPATRKPPQPPSPEINTEGFGPKKFLKRTGASSNGNASSSTSGSSAKKRKLSLKKNSKGKTVESEYPPILSKPEEKFNNYACDSENSNSPSPPLLEPEV